MLFNNVMKALITRSYHFDDTKVCLSYGKPPGQAGSVEFAEWEKFTLSYFIVLWYHNQNPHRDIHL